MDEAALRLLLDDVRAGAVHPDDAVAALRHLPWADLGYARVDHHRALRQGRAEAVYAPGKTAAQCAGIVAELLAQPGDGPVLLSRADREQISVSLDANPGGHVTAATVVWRPAPLRGETVLVVTAGTADLPVAEECRATLRAFGWEARMIVDVGVAGLHRILAHVDDLEAADAVVVIAGMEGALASVVGGLTPAPVVAVPTSVGYGASLEGVTALLGMLASCASGLVVVGIDNGFGAAQAVARLFRTHAAGGRDGPGPDDGPGREDGQAAPGWRQAPDGPGREAGQGGPGRRGSEGRLGAQDGRGEMPRPVAFGVVPG